MPISGVNSHGVSFVSVTQQFNTATSMGRLTLNVLLSFNHSAVFEIAAIKCAACIHDQPAAQHGTAEILDLPGELRAGEFGIPNYGSAKG
jgi:hypothetical protein